MGVSRILLLMDNRGDANWGSQATTNALVGLLTERFPGAEIRGVPRSAARPSSSYVRRFATSLALRIVDGRGSDWALRTLTSTWSEQFEWADLVVVNGEGTLHPQPQAQRWICSIIGLARKFKKPYWIVNCSLMCRGDKTEWIYRALLSEAAHVSVREPVSWREVQAMGIDVVQAADCAFLTEPSPELEARQILQQAGITGAFAVMTGSASVKRWDLDHQRSVVAALKQRGLEVLYTHSDRHDVVNYAALGLSIPVVSHNEASYRQLTAIQGLAEIVVGGRFHPSILAAMVGTPFVALPSNTHKMSGVMEMLDAEPLLCDFGSLDRVIPKINEVLDARDAWSESLRSAANRTAPLARLNVPSA
jgi:polysaccharide pyruvyl transferase WcaK-like protein